MLLFGLMIYLVVASTCFETLIEVDYENKTYQFSNLSVNVSLVLHGINCSINQTHNFTLLVNELAIDIGNISNISYLVALNTSQLGRREFRVMLRNGNITEFNKSFGYIVTNDWDNDSFVASELGGLDCNDTNPSINPGMTEIPNNGLDDDCNASTPDTKISIEPLSQSFDLGDPVKLEIEAPQGEVLKLYIYKIGASSISYAENITGEYPLNISILALKSAGNYSVNLNNNNFLEEVSRFEISNSITAEMDVDPDEPLVNEDAIFEGLNAGGGFSPYTYRWEFGDGKDATGRVATHAYSKPGEYKVILEVEDSEGNSKQIERIVEVLNTYKITVITKDSKTKKPIPGVELIIDTQAKTTDKDGKASFNLPAGRHRIEAYDADYEPKYTTIKVTKPETFTVNLERIIRDEIPPEIELIKPDDKARFIREEVELVFRASDEASFTCSLLKSEDKEWWLEEWSGDEPKGNNEESVTITGLENGTYYWKVSCEDESGNAAESEVRQFNVDRTPKTLKDIKYEEMVDDIKNKTNLFKIELDNLLETASRFSPQQKEVAGLLSWSKDINRRKKQMDYFARDIYNLRFRRVNSSERLRLAENITRMFSETRDSTITDIRVANYDRSVYYPSKEELHNISNQFLKANGYTPRKYDLSAYYKKNEDLQQKLSVTTHFYHLELSYYNGNKEKVTLVHKRFTGNLSKDNISLLEFVPKGVVESAGKLQIITKNEVLLDDPLIRFEPENDSIVYILPGHIPYDKLKGTHLVALSNEIHLERIKSVTGFSIAELFHLKDKTSVAFVIALIVVVVLGYYLLHSLGFIARVWGLVKGRQDYRAIEKLQALISEAKENLNRNEVDKAVVIFKEMELFFNELSDKSREQILGEIREVADQINMAKIDTLFNNAVYLVENTRIEEAKRAFNIILQFYNKLPDNLKKSVYERITSLRGMILENG